MEDEYLSGPNQAALSAKWNRVAGELCGTENLKALAP
jgi:hypothetical protein